LVFDLTASTLFVAVISRKARRAKLTGYLAYDRT